MCIYTHGLEGLPRGNTYSKNIKKILYKTLKGILTAKIANIETFFVFFDFPIYKRDKYKNESNIS